MTIYVLLCYLRIIITNKSSNITNPGIQLLSPYSSRTTPPVKVLTAKPLPPMKIFIQGSPSQEKTGCA